MSEGLGISLYQQAGKQFCSILTTAGWPLLEFSSDASKVLDPTDKSMLSVFLIKWLHRSPQPPPGFD